MEPNSGPQKPRIIIMVVLSVIAGVLKILVGFSILSIASQLAANIAIPVWEGYMLMISGVALLVAAVLVLQYKRLGLYLAGIVTGIGVLSNIYTTLANGNLSIIDIALDAVIVYFAYLYLTREPHKSFFS